MRAGAKSVSEIMSDLEKYLVYFNNESDNIKSYIGDLDNSISSVKNQIKEAENSLKTKLEEISNKNKKINEKLHDVSGDYDELYLMSAAEELKELRTAKEDIENDSKELIDELKNNLKSFEEEKNDNVAIKEKINNIKSTVEKDLKETYKSCDVAVSAIRKAIEVCSNPNLTIALDEEEGSKDRRLEDIANKYKKEIESLLNRQNTEEKINVTTEDKVVRNDTEDIFENRNTIEVDNISFDEPEYNESKVEIEIEEPIKEEALPVNENNFDEDRKVIDIKTISEDQIAAIENSSIVENGLKDFFN